MRPNQLTKRFYYLLRHVYHILINSVQSGMYLFFQHGHAATSDYNLLKPFFCQCWNLAQFPAFCISISDSSSQQVITRSYLSSSPVLQKIKTVLNVKPTHNHLFSSGFVSPTHLIRALQCLHSRSQCHTVVWNRNCGKSIAAFWCSNTKEMCTQERGACPFKTKIQRRTKLFPRSQ